MKDFLKQMDWSVFAAMLALSLIGIITIWSASYQAGTQEYARFHTKQLAWLFISLAAYLAVSLPSYKKLEKFAYWFFAAALVSLAGVLIVGTAVHQARRWFHFGPIRITPSEFVKVAYVLALAKFLMYRDNYASLKRLIAPLVLTIVPFILIIRQPDLGTALILFPIFFAMLYASGARMKHLGILLFLGILLTPVVYLFGLKDYQRSRITGFLSPEDSPIAAGYQVIQSKIAIGSGGILGKGWGEGTQNYLNYVPERRTDFIFSVIGEEWGFAGSLAVFSLYLFLYARCLKIAYDTREPFGRLVVVGIVTLLMVQTFINIGMTMGLMPITGLTLPFISYGGSSLLSSTIAIAIIINVKAHVIPQFSGREYHHDTGEVPYVSVESKLTTHIMPPSTS